MYLSFEHEFYLVFLFIIPVLIFFHFYGLKNLKGSSLRFANFEAIARVKGIDLYSKNVSSLVLSVLFVVFLVFALSGLILHTNLEVSYYSFVIAIDSSQSMTATDLSPDRLSAAKETAMNFVDSLPFGSVVGVLSFSGNSKIEKELTSNKEDLKTAIRGIETNLVGGTDVFEAISNSGRLLKKEKNKAVILLSDGQINVGNIQEIIDYAKENKIVIYTIGIGTIGGGEFSYGMSKLDEDSLKSLSYNTDGRYFSAESKAKLDESFKELITTAKRTSEIDLSPYLIIIAIFLFLIKQYLTSINKMI